MVSGWFVHTTFIVHFIYNIITSAPGDPGLIPGSGRSPGEGNGKPLQYSCLENHMDQGAWWATPHGVTESRTWLSANTHTHTHTLRSLGIRSPRFGTPAINICPHLNILGIKMSLAWMALHRLICTDFLTHGSWSNSISDSTTYSILYNHLMIHSTKMHWPFTKDHSGTGYSTRNRTCPPHPLLMDPGILVMEGVDSSR